MNDLTEIALNALEREEANLQPARWVVDINTHKVGGNGTQHKDNVEY